MSSAREKLLQANKVNISNTNNDKINGNFIDDIISNKEDNLNDTTQITETTSEQPKEQIKEPQKQIEKEVVVQNNKKTKSSNKLNEKSLLLNSLSSNRKSKSVSLRLYPDIYDKLQEISNDTSLSVNDIINQLLRNVLF